MTDATTATRPRSSKATLYCFECGHESPIPGDWRLFPAGDRVVYRCPECETAITERPRSESGPQRHASDSNRCPCPGD